MLLPRVRFFRKAGVSSSSLSLSLLRLLSLSSPRASLGPDGATASHTTTYCLQGTPDTTDTSAPYLSIRVVVVVVVPTCHTDYVSTCPRRPIALLHYRQIETDM